jgi:hypothetical protein
MNSRTNKSTAVEQDGDEANEATQQADGDQLQADEQLDGQ